VDFSLAAEHAELGETVARLARDELNEGR